MNRIFSALETKKSPLCVVGLGYVGLPLACLLAKHFRIVGFDIDEDKIKDLRSGIDRSGEVSDEDLHQADIVYSFRPAMLKLCPVVIVCVPTPTNPDGSPDLTPLEKASEIVGKVMSKNTVVVYESTVYPGTTESTCRDILQAESGLEAGEEFFVGYSPERVNPGDKVHTIDKIVKLVAGEVPEVTDLLVRIYGRITNTHRCSSIRVGEAAKLLENVQRDVNIALMNEYSIIMNEAGIPSMDVIDAAATKWNFNRFVPGLVGGHCIGVDPNYLIEFARPYTCKATIAQESRRINDHVVPEYIVEQTVRRLSGNSGKLAILGVTFKEDVPDFRNSKVIDIARNFRVKYPQIKLFLHDPVVDKGWFEGETGFTLTEWDKLPNDLDGIIYAVRHVQFLGRPVEDLVKKMTGETKVLIDIKSSYPREACEVLGLTYWSL